jgi:1-acyl-sn-glycerol-3-phosphate acyltransferase
VLYRALELTVAPAIRAVYRPHVTGLANVPRTGPVIIAGNHVSFADEIFTPLAARRQVFYFAKAEYFNSPGLRGSAMGAFFRGLGQVPVERGDTRSAAASIDIGVDVLREGKALGIYPEGTRSPDGRLHKFRTGVARLAIR